MANTTIYKKDQFIYYEFENTKALVATGNFSLQHVSPTEVYICAVVAKGYRTPINNLINRVIPIATIVNRLGVAYGTTFEELIFGFNLGLDTNWQDQTTDSVFVKFNQVHDSTTLASNGVKDAKTIVVTDATGIAIGSYVILFHPGSIRFSTFTAIDVVGTTITLDSWLDFSYPAGTFVDIAITNMAVNGSVTPQVFGLRGTGIIPGVEITVHFTRFIFECLTASAVSLAEFGDIPALESGLFLRTRNTRTHNEWNVKSNGEIAGIMYDWTPYVATNPIQGQDGFVSRLTYGGPEKVGVVLALPIGMDAEFPIQEDLTAITSLEIVAEGHITYL